MKQPKYFEKQGTSFLFTKRLNDRHGVFPAFQARLKKKLAATTEAEATTEALALSNEIDHLQKVCLKDSRHLTIPVRDMNRAAKTWVETFSGIDLEQTKILKDRHTREAEDARECLGFAIGEVVDFFGAREEGSNGAHVAWLSNFGDLLLAYLKEGERAGTLVDAVPAYLKQTNRSHLPETNKAVKDTYRLVNLFSSIVGEKSLEQISRRDVDFYVSARLEKVKTTSVERELKTIRAVWHKAALVKDLKQQNPFAETSIPGLNTDAVKRPTPTLEETRGILKHAEALWNGKPSYVSCLIAIAALTGARLGEAWGLEQADWKDDTLHIRPNSTRNSLKTANSARPFPALPELQKWLQRLFSCKTRAGSANSASAACNKALNGFVMHSLRHGMKQRLVDADIPLNVLEELLGWSSQRTSALYGQNTARAAKTGYVRGVYASLFPTPNRSGNVLAFTKS